MGGLSPGTEYVFRVAACAEQSVSPKSQGILILTKGTPLPVPSDLKVIDKDMNSITLSWKVNVTGQWV